MKWLITLLVVLICVGTAASEDFLPVEIANGSHEAGGCLVPVRILHDAGVGAIVVGGMGARPMQGFAEVGIKVYFASRETCPDVGSVIAQLTANNLPVMHTDQLCKGAGNCHH